jgi:hypothetical protein
VAFRNLSQVCTDYFGSEWQSGISHAVFRTPWIGDPRFNMQNDLRSPHQRTGESISIAPSRPLDL